MASLRELTLDEMLADPIVHLMMARDGVVEAEVRALLNRALVACAAGHAVAAQARTTPLGRAA